MKRGTTSHPKVNDLVVALGVPRYVAVGILESVWQFVMSYAVPGDLGRHSDAAIAQAIGWESDPGALVAALVVTRWLDRCACHRLRVHDWPSHADQTTKRVLGNRNQKFLACYDDPSSVLGSSQPVVVVDVDVDVERWPGQHRASTPAVVRAPNGNPLVDGRMKELASKFYGLVTEESLALDEDPTVVAARHTEYQDRSGRTTVKYNAFEMRPERLLNSIRSLELAKAVREEKARVAARPEAVTVEDRYKHIAILTTEEALAARREERARRAGGGPARAPAAGQVEGGGGNGADAGDSLEGGGAGVETRPPARAG